MATGRSFAVVLDEFGLRSHEFRAAQRVGVELLRRAAPTDRILVANVSSGVVSSGTLPDDRDALDAAIEGLQPSMFLDRLGGVDRGSQAVFREIWWKRINVLVEVLDHLKTLPGRRSLLLLTRGWMYPVQGLGREAHERLMRASLSADATVSVFMCAEKTRGMESARSRFTEPVEADEDAGRTGSVRTDHLTRSISFAERLIGSSLSDSIALDSGGFVERGNAAAAVDGLVAGQEMDYVVGYRPEPFKADGKFHRVAVRVRRPHATVRHRKGYYAPQP